MSEARVHFRYLGGKSQGSAEVSRPQIRLGPFKDSGRWDTPPGEGGTP